MRAFVLLILGVFVGTTGCSRSPATRSVPAEAPAPTATGYADPRLCAGCHAEIAKTYRETGMGRAFAAASPATLNVEDFEKANRLDHGASNRHYQMLRRGDRYFLRRHQVGYQGKETNVVEMEIHYVMGSGNHARSYLHRTAQNRLIELPVGWYAEGGGRWAMSPGYDRPNHPDFRRAVGYGCMFCHNAYPAVEPGHDMPGDDPVYPATLPSGIDCQRCHGPGKAHIEAAQAKKPLETIHAAIVNPKRLPLERQTEVCMQCHLETTSWSLPHAIQKLDRGTFTYRPGEPLAGYALHFDHAPGSGREAKFEIVNSFYRLRQSACFVRSAGKLKCTTCHNPHEAKRGVAAQQQYTAVCRSCHQKSHAPTQDCAGCHMPKRRTEDVVHVVMTDHKIQRRGPANPLVPRGELTERESVYRGPVVLYYPPSLPASAERDLYLALAQVAENSNAVQGIPQLEAAIARHQPASPEFRFELAQAQFKNGQRDAAIASYQQILSFAPALRGLGAAQTAAGSLDAAIATLERAKAAAPTDPLTRHEMARAYLQKGRYAQAIEEASAAIRLNPDLPVAHETLASAYVQSGETVRAEASFREAVRLQPDFPEAHSDLANLLTSRNDYAQAEYHFRAALALAPAQAAIRYNYGVSLAMAQRFADAERELAKVVTATPGMAEAHEALGGLARQRGDWPTAVQHYRNAVSARPGFERALLGLGTALGATGDLAGARTFLRQASAASDASVRNEAMETLRMLEEAVGKGRY